MKKCKMCGELFLPSVYSKYRQVYCGSYTNKTGCFHLNVKNCNRKSRLQHYSNNKKKLYEAANLYNRVRDDGLYIKYAAMVRRCKYPSQNSYKYYGGRGILVTWKSYKNFKEDMYQSYLEHIIKYGKKETTLDRINGDKNYCKENCRWATHREQMFNRDFTRKY